MSWLWRRNAAGAGAGTTEVNTTAANATSNRPKPQRKSRVTARDLSRSKYATKQNAAIKPLTAAETKTRPRRKEPNTIMSTTCVVLPSFYGIESLMQSMVILTRHCAVSFSQFLNMQSTVFSKLFVMLPSMDIQC